MKAIVYEGFGSPDILRCQDIETPTPGENEVLIKVRAASINPLDWKMMKGGPLPVRILLGIGKPKIRRPGVDVAGEVEAVGGNVKQFNRATRYSVPARAPLLSMRFQPPRSV